MDKLTRRALAYADRYVRGWCQDFEVPEHARDDALQEACIEALKRVRTFDAARGQMLEEWIRAQMEPRLFRWLKRLHHGGITGTAEAKTPIGVFNAVVEEPQDAETGEDVARMLQAVDDLSATEYGLLRAFFNLDGAGRTQRELALELGVNQSTVSRRVQSIIEKITIGACIKSGSAGNPYRGDEAQTESPGKGIERAALGGGATVHPSYLSTEYKHLKQHFRKLCEKTGYPSSSVPKQHGIHDEQTGPGTMSTKCSEWVPDSKFWTPPRKKARRDAAIRFADLRREFRMENKQHEEQLAAIGTDMSEAAGGDNAGEFFLRQARRSDRYDGLLLLGTLDELDDGDVE